MASTTTNSNSRTTRPRRNFYGRSATTSVTQLLSESDVVKTCTSLLQRLTTKNLGSGLGNSSGNPSSGSLLGQSPSSRNNYSSSNNNNCPDSPNLTDMSHRGVGPSSGLRKTSNGSICSTQSDAPYAFVKYKPPLPTGTTTKQHQQNHTDNQPLTTNGDGNNNTTKPNGVKSNFSYFGNDRLKELELKFTERYNRLFGPSSASAIAASVGKKSTWNAGTDVLRPRAAEPSGSGPVDDFRGYGLAKSASTSSGRAYPSASTYGYGNLGTAPAVPPLTPATSSTDNYSSVYHPRTTGGSYDVNPRRSYGLAKSVSSSILQDSGLGSSGSLNNATTPSNPPSASAGMSKYYPYPSYTSGTQAYSSGRVYGSNSTLLEPVLETNNSASRRYANYRERDRERAREISSGLARSTTSQNLIGRTDSEDSSSRDDKTNSSWHSALTHKSNGEKSPSAETEDPSESGPQRKGSYKLPSRYYYRRFRNKSSYAPTKEISPLAFSNHTAHADAEDDSNNNTVPKTNSSMSHVLAYNLSPRARAIVARDDDVLSPEEIAKLNLVDVVVGETVDKENTEIESEVDLIRKKEIEELIKKYSGLTYSPATTTSTSTKVLPSTTTGPLTSDNTNETARKTSIDETHTIISPRSRLNQFSSNLPALNPSTSSANILLAQNGNTSSNSHNSIVKSSSNYGSLFNNNLPSSSSSTNLPADRSYAKVLRNGKENFNSVIHNANVSWGFTFIRVVKCVLKIRK